MAADYTNWFTAADVLEKLAAAGISIRDDWRGPTYFDRVIKAVTSEITRRTHRQFVVTRTLVADVLTPVSEVRYFDGSGTGTQEVDECVSLTSVSVIGFVGTTPGLSLQNVYLRRDNNYPNTLIEIYQASLPAITLVYLDRFPSGRQNIKVDAVWGYGPEVPGDLWEAGAGEAAARLGAEFLFNPDGRLQEWKEADATSEKYLLQLPGEAAGWHDTFNARVSDYTRDVSRNLRKMRPAMI